MKPTFFILVTAAVLFFNQQSVAVEINCVRTQLQKGSSCDNLDIAYDFSLCPAPKPEGKAIRSKCVNQKAVSVYRNDNELYIATYGAPQKAGQSWVKLTVRKEVRGGASQAQSSSVSAPPLLPPVQPKSNVEVENLRNQEGNGVIVSGQLLRKAEDVAAKTDENLKTAEMYAQSAAPADSKGAPSLAPATVEKTEMPKGETATQSVQFSGFFDFYYTYNVNSPAGMDAQGAGYVNTPTQTGNNALNKYHAYDRYNEQFTLSMAMLRAKREVEGSGFQIDFGFGQSVPLMEGPYSTNTQHVLQGFAKYKVGKKSTFFAGKLLDHLGLESPYSIENSIYSRSFLNTYGTPVSHTGVAIETQYKPNFAATWYLYNDWVGTFDSNRTKNIGLRLNWTKSPTFTMQYNFLGGNEKVVADSFRQVHNVNFVWKKSEKFTLQFDGIFGTENKAVGNTDTSWSGANIGLSWKRGRSLFAARLEAYMDTDGYTIDGNYTTRNPAQNITSVALDNTWDMGNGGKTMVEVRMDSSDRNSFRDQNNALSTSQVVGLMAFTYQY